MKVTTVRARQIVLPGLEGEFQSADPEREAIAAKLAEATEEYARAKEKLDRYRAFMRGQRELKNVPDGMPEHFVVDGEYFVANRPKKAVAEVTFRKMKDHEVEKLLAEMEAGDHEW